MTTIQPSLTSTDSECNLEQIAYIQTKIAQLKKALETALDSFAKNNSMLTRMANAWHVIPFWAQIIIGCVLIIPLAILTVITQIAALVVVSLSLTLIFCIGSYLLKEHHQKSQFSTEQFKNIVTHLVSLLGDIITLLNEVHAQLKEEVERFRIQNNLLEEQVQNISEELATQKRINQKLLEVQSSLHDIIKSLEHTSATLQVQTEEQVMLLAKAQEEREHTQKQLDATQKELVKANKKMEEMNLATQESLEKANQITAVLNSTLNGLIKSMTITTEAQKSSLLKKISTFVEGTDVCLSDFASQLNGTVGNLTQLGSQYEQTLSKIEDLAQKQHSLISHLSGVLPSSPTTPLHETSALTTMGVFATTPMQQSPEITLGLPLAAY